jgi:hypothetical protein
MEKLGGRLPQNVLLVYICYGQKALLGPDGVVPGIAQFTSHFNQDDIIRVAFALSKTTLPNSGLAITRKSSLDTFKVRS